MRWIEIRLLISKHDWGREKKGFKFSFILLIFANKEINEDLIKSSRFMGLFKGLANQLRLYLGDSI